MKKNYNFVPKVHPASNTVTGLKPNDTLGTKFEQKSNKGKNSKKQLSVVCVLK